MFILSAVSSAPCYFSSGLFLVHSLIKSDLSAGNHVLPRGRPFLSSNFVLLNSLKFFISLSQRTKSLHSETQDDNMLFVAILHLIKMNKGLSYLIL